MLKEGQIKLPDDVSELKAIIHSQQKKAVEFEREIQYLKNNNEFFVEELNLLRLKLYTRISERFEEDLEDVRRLLFADWSLEVKEVEPEEATLVKEHQRKKTGRKPLPEDLPRIEVIHDISDEEKKCECGSEKSRIGEETSERLKIKPAKLWVEKTIRPKYACRSCEGVESEGNTVSIAPVPPSMIPKSFASPSLLSHILIGKFCDALPFYRQEQQFKRYDVQISRATMVNWSFYVAARLKPLFKMLRLWILSGPLINIDETPTQVLKEPGREPESKSYMWVFRGGSFDMPGVYYHYSPGRSGQIVKTFLGDFTGHIQTDGYQGYNFLDFREGIMHSGCWAHVRRKFNDVVKAAGKKNKPKIRGKGKASHAMGVIRDLYLIEREAKNKGFDEEQTYHIRQEKSLPVINEFALWLKETAPKVPPQCLLGKAIYYTLGQWPRLIKYLDHGVVRMDNNLVENAIRPFAVGRKNWLFSVTPQGAETSALFYSLIETAKANGLDPFKYFKYLFEKYPHAKSTEDIFKLLPMNISKIDLQ